MATDPPAPPFPDSKSHFIDRAVASREAELKQTTDLWTQSVAASLPAVGRQVHWEKNRDELSGALQELKKQSARQYRLQWKNQKVMVVEAIRKMRFVRLELMYQLTQDLKSQSDSPQSEQLKKQALLDLKNQSADKQTFPYDGLVWPDELFQLRSTAASQCL